LKVALGLTLILVLADPAQAYQTEVSSQEMHDLAERIERRRAEAAATVVEAPPVEAPAPVPSYPAGVLMAFQVAEYARGAGFPEPVITTMVAIAWRESRFNPGAINSSSGACGLWQMYPCPGPEALNPATNAAMAYAKYAASGLSPWGY
jgi:soluble lytic murein transglycosylase-like protein